MTSFVMTEFRIGTLCGWHPRKKNVGAYNCYKVNVRDSVPCSRCLGSLHRAWGERCFQKNCVLRSGLPGTRWVRSSVLSEVTQLTCNLVPFWDLGGYDTFYMTTWRKSGAFRAIRTFWTSAYWVRFVCFSRPVRGPVWPINTSGRKESS